MAGGPRGGIHIPHPETWGGPGSPLLRASVGNPAAAEARHPVPAPAPRVGRPNTSPAGPPPGTTGRPADRNPGISRCAGGAMGPIRKRGAQLAGATQSA